MSRRAAGAVVMCLALLARYRPKKSTLMPAAIAIT